MRNAGSPTHRGRQEKYMSWNMIWRISSRRALSVRGADGHRSRDLCAGWHSLRVVPVEGVHPAEEALAECLGVDANVGPEDKVLAVGGRLIVDDGSPNPRPPASSGALQPIAAKVLMKTLYGARIA
eukprot:4728242-Pyramimonas_sp.AAC.1